MDLLKRCLPGQLYSGCFGAEGDKGSSSWGHRKLNHTGQASTGEQAGSRGSGEEDKKPQARRLVAENCG